MSFRRMAAGTLVAGILAVGCSGGDSETAPSTFPENGLTAEEVATHRVEIRHLQAEKDEAAELAVASREELTALLASLSTDCLVAIENYRFGGKYGDVDNDEALDDTKYWCGPENPRAVIEVRVLDWEVADSMAIVDQRSESIAAHLGALKVEPPVPTTLG